MRTLSATQACEILGIQAATLYAYVSRGWIRSEEVKGSRQRRYRAEDIEQLRQKQLLRSHPETLAGQSLDWGLPLLDSSVSDIYQGQLFYRGQTIEHLIEQSIEELIALLWQKNNLNFQIPLPVSETPRLSQQSELGLYEQLQLSILWAGFQDSGAFDLSPQGVLQSSLHILNHFYAFVSGQADNTMGLLHRFYMAPAHLNLLRVLLIVCADHELNNSTFTARCVASSRASPYACIHAALCSFEGLRHGGASRHSEALLSLCQQSTSLKQALRQWRQQGQSISFLEHRLYPQGDPRWHILSQLFERDFAHEPIWITAQALLQELNQTAAPAQPNLDFALAIAAGILNSDAQGAPSVRPAIVWFALGRIVGWLAHIQEQYTQELLIRPRSRQIVAQFKQESRAE